MNQKLQQFTKLFNWILVGVVFYTCHHFYTDRVVYKMQVQIPLISKAYFCFNSREFCLTIVILCLLCIFIMRWWVTLMVLVPLLPLPAYVLYWIKLRYNYIYGFINGMIWYTELFNYNINIYFYKGLEEWQKSWVVWKEITLRQNIVSFLVYGDCRDYHDDPVIMHFFDNFHLDYNDSENFERIRNQLDKYQSVELLFQYARNNWSKLEYQAENPFKYYGAKILDYIIEYPERIFLYSFVGFFAAVILFYHT